MDDLIVIETKQAHIITSKNFATTCPSCKRLYCFAWGWTTCPSCGASLENAELMVANDETWRKS